MSPDYPYLALGVKEAAAWADLMHYQHTGNMVKAGVGQVKAMTGNVRDKAFAWLLGYAAHVITDATILPVVKLKVGRYAERKTEHRICEMHQDAYIYQRLDVGGLGVADFLKSGLERCCLPDGTLDPAVVEPWFAMLRRCYPDSCSGNPPDINCWQRGYTSAVNLSEEGYRLLPLARHVAVNCGLTYPLYREVDRRAYIDSLETPHGRLTYDQIFEKALRHVVEGWHLIGEAVFGDSTLY